MISDYLKIVKRNLIRDFGFSLINISGLSMGLACVMLIILYVKDEVSYDRFHISSNNIFRITTKEINPDGSLNRLDGNTGILQGPTFASSVANIQSFTRLQVTYLDIKYGNEIHSKEVLAVDSNFLNIFSFPLLYGNPNTALQGSNSIVISEDEARLNFGTTDALNRTIMVKDQDRFIEYVITGVSKKCPQNSSIKFNILTSMQISKDVENDYMSWLNMYLNTFIVLAPKSDVKSVEEQMNKVYRIRAKEAIQAAAELYDFKNRQMFSLQPLTEMHLSRELPAENGLVDASNPVYSYMLLSIAAFVLIIACINFINLTIVKSLKRTKEIGIRKVVGSARKQLVFQFLTESYFVCFLAFSVAILIVLLTLPLFNQLSNKELSFSYLLDTRLFVWYLILFLITGLVAGSYPAMVLSKFKPVETLYNHFPLAGKNLLQKILVVIQFSLASFLIVCCFVFVLQFDYLVNKNLGYNDDNLITIEKHNLTRNEFRVFKNELLKCPSVVDVAAKNLGQWRSMAKVNRDSSLNFAYETVDASYLTLLKVPIVYGRNFSEEFPGDSINSVLVNETFVKRAGWDNPIGQRINFWYRNNETYSVVGVVKDYHYESLTKEIAPQLFTMRPGNQYGIAYIKIIPGSEASSLKKIQMVFKNLFRFNPFIYKFKDDDNDRNYESEDKWKKIIISATILSIFISCMGLFGLSLLSTKKRNKEIGIRKVLGAPTNSIVLLLVVDFIKLVVIALLISIPIAWFVLTKWLEHYPYRIFLDWRLFGFSGLLVIFIAMLTIGYQVIKTALKNPVDSLRTE
jgi:putative ABC transport system permease protein